jgi:plasmid stability protein
MLQYGSKLELHVGVDISIKNVPAEKVEILKQRAKANHRSLQGELMAIIDQVVKEPARAITFDELAEHGRRLGLSTPSEATRWIRESRDAGDARPKLTIDEAVAKVSKLRLSRHNEAVRMIREDRDR